MQAPEYRCRPSRFTRSVCSMASWSSDTFQRRRDEVTKSLGEIKHSRRALSSYDHIKTFDKEQRIYRRARELSSSDSRRVRW